MRMHTRFLSFSRSLAIITTLLIATSVPAHAAQDNTIAMPQPVVYGDIGDNGHSWETFAIGLEEGGPCYSVLTSGDVSVVISQAVMEQLLSENLTMTDALTRVGGRYGSARYIGLLVIGRVGNTFVMTGRILDSRAMSVVAVGQRTANTIDPLIEGARSLGRELGSKLPCSIEIEGTRQIDLATYPDVQNGMLGGMMTMFRAVAPLVVGQPTFAGRLTQTDTIKSTLVISPDDTVASGEAAWTAVVDAPRITMTAPQADVDTTRAPYTLTFAKKMLTGTYDKPTRTAHFDIEMLDQGVATGGAGQATVTLKDQLKAVTVDTVTAMQELLGALAGPGAVKAAEEAALKDADAPPGFDPNSATNTMPVPAPNQTDAVHFKLAFDLNLREDDEKRVSGSDEIGKFDYVVRVKRER